MGGDVRIFDVPYWRGPGELIHLSVISPVADDLAVVYLPLLPAGLWELPRDLDIRMVEVPDEEFPTLGCNVLAVRPGVVIMADGNPTTAAALAAAGCEVHTYPATEIGINGSGGPTCMTRPILRGEVRSTRPADRGPPGARPDPERDRLRGGRRGLGGRRPRTTST